METANTELAALAYAARGWFVFPCTGKDPLTQHGFKDASTDPSQIRAWWTKHPNANIGLDLGRTDLLAIDIDPRNGGLESWGEIYRQNGPLPYTVTSCTGGNGFHYLYRVPEGLDVQTLKGKLAQGIDVKKAGGYIILPPSIHPETHKTYQWETERGLDVIDIAPMPQALIDLLQKGKPKATAARSAPTHVGNAYAQAALTDELGKVKASQDGTRNNTLNTAAYSLGQLVGANVLDRATVEAELFNAAMAAGLPEREAQNTIDSGLSAGIAQPRTLPTNAPIGPTLPNDLSDVLRHAHLTDAGNANCLEALHSDKLKFCHTRGKWLFWNGELHRIDETGHARRLMKATVLARQAQIPKIEDEDAKKRFARYVVDSENERRIQSALSSASVIESIATTIDLYDRDPMLANAGSVTLDLRNGQARANRQADYITRRLGANYDQGATYPRWNQFLHEIFSSDQDLISYIRRAVGYSLTGDTREQKLFLCHGAGANGKSVFLTTLSKLLGEYAASRSFATFDADERNRVGDDLAGLKGIRLVTVIETNEDRRLNEARVKSLTGQDVINCRFLFGEYFSFRPEFKLWLAMNHKPAIYGTDRAIWRRIQLIPFTQTFEGREDKVLESKLQAELPGILNWALQGLIEWHAQGLNPPTAVTEATERYRAESDIVGQWIDDCIVSGAQMEMKSGDGYRSFKEWSVDHGIQRPLSLFHWARRMEEHGFTPGAHTGRGKFYKGIGLVTSSNS